MTGRSAQEIRQQLLAKREKQLEEAAKRKECLVQASKAVEDLHILGLGFSEIGKLSGASDEFIRDVYTELKLRAPPVTVPTPIEVVAAQTADIGTNSRGSSVVPEADTFGAPRWANGLTVDLSVSESSSEEEGEDESMNDAEGASNGSNSNGGGTSEISQAPSEQASQVKLTSTPQVPNLPPTQTPSQPQMSPRPMEPQLASTQEQPEDVQAELQRVRQQIKEMQAKNEAMRAAKANQGALMATLGPQFQQLMLRREAISRRLQSLNIPKFQKRITRLTNRLEAAKNDMKRLLKEETRLTSQLAETAKMEEALRSQMFAAHMSTMEVPAQVEQPKLQTGGDGDYNPPEPVQAVDYEDVDMSDGEEESDDAEKDLVVEDDAVANNYSEKVASAEQQTCQIPESPLMMFSSWRFSHENIAKPGRCFSPTFNARFIPDIEEKEFCVAEAAGKSCPKRKECECVHGEDFNVPAMTVLNYMSSCMLGDDLQKYRSGLHEYMERKRREPLVGNGNLSEHIARWIIEYRKSVDPTRFLDWNGWKNIKGEDSL